MNGKLSLKEKICYGFGDVQNLGYYFISFYFLYFCTNIAGIPSSYAGVVIFVGLLFDAVNDLFVGIVSDRSRPGKRFGRYQKFMVSAVVPYAIFVVLCFVTPSGSLMLKLVWAYVVYLAYTLAHTFFLIPFGSIASVMTLDANERVTLGAFRDFGTNVASFVVNTFAVLLITKLSKDPNNMDARGFMLFALIVGIVIVIVGLIAVFGTKERYDPGVNVKEDFRTSIKAVATNGQAWVLIAIVFLMNLFVNFKGNFTLYYTQYYLGNVMLTSSVLSLMGLLPLVGLFFVPKLNQILGSKKMFCISAVSAILSGVCTLLAQHNLVLVYAASVFAGITLSGVFANVWGNLPNAADYIEYQTGVRAPSLTYSSTTFMIKLSGAIASYGASLVLTLTKFDPSLETQSAATVSATYWVYGLVPVVCGVIALVISLQYKLDKKYMDEIQAKLAAKKG